MFARKIVPILLVVGAIHMLKHRRHEMIDDSVPGGDQPHHPHFKHAPFDRSQWAKRVPPMFEMLHNRAHAAMDAKQTTSPEI